MSPSFGQNRATIQQIWDSRFTDQEMIDMLTDIDCTPAAGTSHADLLQALMDWFYDC